MKKLYFILSLLLSAVMFPNNALPQEKDIIEGKDMHSVKESYHSTLDEISAGITSGKIAAISNLFSSQIYLNLFNSVSGYYSSNQAFYVVQEFFKTHQVLSLNLNDVQEDDENVYAAGTYNYMVKGKIESSQIYICLKRSSKKWKITQITIN